jgi:hypothetical protein
LEVLKSSDHGKKHRTGEAGGTAMAQLLPE